MIAQSNVTHMLVGKDIAILSAGSTRDSLAIGQIGVFLAGSKGAKTNALAAGDKFTIAYRNAEGVVIETPVIEYRNVLSKSAVAYQAPTHQVLAIGFNGTDGKIDAKDNTDYVLHIFWSDNSANFSEITQVKFAAYASGANATQLEIANGLIKNLRKQFSREPIKPFIAELITSDAGDAIGTGVVGLKFTKGSKLVSVSTSGDIDDTTGNATALAAGAYIRVGTEKTDPVYKIASIDTTKNTLLLEDAYQGESVELEDDDMLQVSSNDVAAGDMGVKISALPISNGLQPGIFRYDQIRFDIKLKDSFGDTKLTEVVAPTKGSGSYGEVAEVQWFLKGNRGEPWRQGNYPKTVVLDATPGKSYDMISFDYVDYNAKTLDRQVGSFGSVLIATETGSINIHATLKTILGLS
jgi:hypothetical protein